MAKNKPKPRSSGSSKPKSSTRPTVARPGANTLEGKAQPYLKRVENLLTDLDSKRGAYMAECKVVREDIKEIYGEAKDHGISVKALKALVEYRVLEKKQAKLAEDFDIEEQAAYSQLVSALGPLGFAAAQRAGYLPANENAGEERDVRPRHMTQPGASAVTTTENGNGDPAPRADEAELARLGRGREAEPDAPAGEGSTEPPPVTH